ncbi:unnamed protein product [Echinostoma caproni]|uniref:Abnormal spindle-like microcephaly-associated protein ASH domain-containing protein n=1 Tax=Echinostoma caproni TaxID=27848 RepID=A0A3P8JSC7_9TREM|nr:unnamed protein product [Echinostoma caproni]
MLPVQWKLAGVDSLGEEFSVPQDAGIVEPKSDFVIYAYFRAMKPFKSAQKKSLRLEVYDMDNLAGSDGGIDFGLARVGEEVKHNLSLKNKGPYEITVKFTISPSVQTDFGAIIVQHRKTRQIIIENNGEHDFRYSILRMTKMRELVAARDAGTIRSKSGDMALLSSPQTKLQLGFFTITPASGTVSPNNAQIITVECFAETRTKSAEELAIEITDRDMKAYRFGVPYMLVAEGHIPGIVTNDPSVIFEEHRISQNLQMFQHEESSDEIHSGGVYGIEENCFMFTNALVGARVRARFCVANRGQVPAEVSFEIVGHVTSAQAAATSRSSSRSTPGVDVFELEPEKVLIEPHSVTYVNVTFVPSAMQKYKASFRAYMDNLPTSGGGSGLSNSGRGSTTPGGSKRSQIGPVLKFDLVGQGHLPSVTVLRPRARNRQGGIMCVFKRLQLRSQTSRVLALKNNGVLSSRVNLTLTDADHVFFLEPVQVNSALLFLNPQALPESKLAAKFPDILSSSDDIRQELKTESQFHTAGLVLRPNVEFAFNVFYRPKQSGAKSLGQIKIVVVNNPYEDTLVDLIGESLADEVCLQDLPQLEIERAISIKEAVRNFQQSTRNSGDTMRLDEVDAELGRDEAQVACALRHNELDFGDCAPTDILSRTFTLVHCGESDTTSFRFAWPTTHSVLQFKPAEGHLHPGHSKRITVTFKPGGVPVSLQSSSVKCVLHRIRVPISDGCDQPTDWDDTQQIIQWVDAPIDPCKNPPVNTAENVHHSNAGSRADSQQTTSRTGSIDQSEIPEFGSVHEVTRKKQKLIETEPEPTYEELPDRTDPKPVELLVSATADYAQYICEVDSIRFRDTMMLQRRVYRFELINSGLVTLHYRWMIKMTSAVPRRQLQDAETTEACDWEPELVPFFVSPSAGSVLPGKSTFIEVTFHPLLPGEFEAQLRGNFDNLASQSETSSKTAVKRNPVIPLAGVAQQSYIYLDMIESDYLSAGRRNPELLGPLGSSLGTSLDPTTRVIEFNTVGVGIKSCRKISIANLTTENLRFSIVNEDASTLKEPPPVVCSVPNGVIAGGKKSEVTLEFTSTGLGLVESFWRLLVNDLDISLPLLVVCSTREPLVVFDRSHVKLHPVLVGYTLSETVYLVNQERYNPSTEESTRALTFKFVESSRYSIGRQDSLTVEPMSGVIEPNSRFPIKISFTAKAERALNINLVCQIQHRQFPLTLNVKAEGFAVKASTWIESTDEGVRNLELSPLWTPCSGTVDPLHYIDGAICRFKEQTKYHADLYSLDFGVVQPGECISRKLTILNTGKFCCDFSSRLISLCNDSVVLTRLTDRLINGSNQPGSEPVLRLNPATSTIAPGENVECSVVFAPPKKISLFPGSRIKLADLSIACLLAVREGPVYGFILVGSTSGQPVHFSSQVIDFGPQLLSSRGLTSAKRYLVLSNTDSKQSASIDCLTPNDGVFQQSLEPTVLQPRSINSMNGSRSDTVRVEVTFTPQACQPYEQEFVYEVNGSIQHAIMIRGEGTDVVMHSKPGPLTIIRINSMGQDRVEQIITVSDSEVRKKPFQLGSLQPNQRSRREPAVRMISRLTDRQSPLVQLFEEVN